MTIIDPNQAKVRASQMADSLQWLSYALILVFLAQVISALFPIALLQPEWMMRVSGTLLGTASLAIMALALIMLANMIDNEVMPSGQHLKLFRRIATFAAIGFLLLIPLQTYATAMGIRTQLKEGQAQLVAWFPPLSWCKKPATNNSCVAPLAPSAGQSSWLTSRWAPMCKQSKRLYWKDFVNPQTSCKTSSTRRKAKPCKTRFYR